MRLNKYLKLVAGVFGRVEYLVAYSSLVSVPRHAWLVGSSMYEVRTLIEALDSA